MGRLGFMFQLQLTFSQPVSRHVFQLRCLPQDSASQQVITTQLHMLPECAIELSQDHFGLKQSGTILLSHAGFSVQAEGIVETQQQPLAPAGPLQQLGPYRHKTTLTAPGPVLTELYRTLPDHDAAQAVMTLLAEKFTYLPGTTHAATTAEEAAAYMQGVCQDEAHIMLALLRMKHIPCRYVMGYMLGEGSTHAWVQVLQQDHWVGLDPTNRRRVNDEYITVAIGRDANDCPVNRGIFTGLAKQQSQSSLSVWRI